MRAVIALLAGLVSLPVLAQQVPSMFHSPPNPWHTGTWGPCGIACRQLEMLREFPPGSCISGTFISADIAVLGQRNIRVRPDAEFWPHNGWKSSGADIAIPAKPVEHRPGRDPRRGRWPAEKARGRHRVPRRPHERFPSLLHGRGSHPQLWLQALRVTPCPLSPSRLSSMS